MNPTDWLATYSGAALAGIAVLLLALTVLVVWQARRLRRLERHYRRLTEGTRGGNLESVLEEHVQEVRRAMDQVRELNELAHRLERSDRRHIQRVGFLRFNPFRDAGGDQSFAVALADEDGNGVAISSLHSREVTRVYGKPLAAWESAYALTDEERQAIQQAKGDER